MFALTSFAMGIIWLILGLSGTQNFPPPLPPKTETELFIKMKQGDDAARTRLIEHNLRLVALTSCGNTISPARIRTI